MVVSQPTWPAGGSDDEDSSGVRTAGRTGCEQQRGVPCCRDQSADRDKVALRAWHPSLNHCIYFITSNLVRNVRQRRTQWGTRN